MGWQWTALWKYTQVTLKQGLDLDLPKQNYEGLCQSWLHYSGRDHRLMCDSWRHNKWLIIINMIIFGKDIILIIVKDLKIILFMKGRATNSSPLIP